MSTSQNQLLLWRINYDRNMERFYSLSLEQSLFGDTALVRDWGRIGTTGRRQIILFEKADEARAQFRQLAHQKRLKGYREFPFKGARGKA